jgi:hypothetical protein
MGILELDPHPPLGKASASPCQGEAILELSPMRRYCSELGGESGGEEFFDAGGAG